MAWRIKLTDGRVYKVETEDPDWAIKVVTTALEVTKSDIEKINFVRGE